ncbi:MAG: hypothetical protein WAU07_00520 [Microgenomates group bacterium]
MEKSSIKDILTTLKKTTFFALSTSWKLRIERVVIPVLASQVESTGLPFATAFLTFLATLGIDTVARKSWIDGAGSGIGAAAFSIFIKHFDEFLASEQVDQAETLLVLLFWNTVPHGVILLLSKLAKHLL